MKKLLALLIACMAVTCSFASCGEEKEENSVAEKSSVSEESSEESSEEESSEEETTEESSEEEEESEEDESSDEEVEKTTHEYIEDGDATAFLGKWECEKMVIEGEEMTDLMGIPVYAVFQLDIKDDNTATMGDSTMAMMSDAEAAVVYTWGMISETEIEIVNETGDAMILEVDGDGDYLIGTEEGYDEQIYLVKVDEFTPFDFEEFMSSFETESDESEAESNAESSVADNMSSESENAEISE